MKIKSNLNRPFLPFLILKSLAMSATSVPSLLVGLVLALNPGTVQAASGNWNADTNGIWSDATKWSSNPTVPGTAPGDTVGLTFDITTNRTITIDTTSRTVGTLNIGDSGSPYYAYTLAASGGATLTFDNSGGGAALNKTGASTAIDTISAPLKLNDNLTVTLTTQPLTISGAISESGGARSLTKAGAGAMTLSGVNTYSGGTVIGGGNLTIGTTTGAGSGSITFSGGARLYVTDGLTIGNDITINNNTGGSGSGLIQNTGNGNATLTGTITINNNAAAGGHFSSVGTGSLTIAGAVNSSVPVSSRTGTVTFSGGGSYTNFLETGMVLIGADNGLSTNTVLYMAASGTATFDLKGHNQTLAGLTNNIANLATVTNSAGAGALTLNVSGANSYAYAGVIGGGANLRLVKNGTGTQTLSGTNTFSGGTTINSGTLVMGGSTALGAASGTLTVNTGGVLNMNGNSGTIGALSGTGGTITSSIAGAITLTDNQAGSTTFAGVMQDGSGTLSFVKTGAGSLTLNGANTYSGATTVNSGALLVNSPGSLGAGSVVTVTNGATLGGNGTISGAVTVAAGATLAPGASAGAIGMLSLANTLTLNGANLNFDISSTNVPGTTYDQIANTTGSLVLNGTNTVSLTGLTGGTYWLITCSGTPSGSGAVVFSNGSTTMGNATLAVVNGGVTLTIINGNDVWKGAVSGVWDGGALNWTRNGSVSNAFVDGDNVTFDNSATNFAVSSGGTVLPSSVTVSNTTAYAISAVIGGTTPLVKSGSGALTLTGSSTFTGDMTINGGILQLGNSNPGTTMTLGGGTYAGDIAFSGGATLNCFMIATETFSGIISGNGNLVVGYTTLTLGTNNTYTGKTSILPQKAGGGGQLNVASFNSVSNNATLGTTHSSSSSLGAPTNAVNGTIALGSGTVQANGTLKYTGPGETTDRIISVVFNGNDSQSIDASGSGLLKFTSAFTTSLGTSGQLILRGTGSGEIVQGVPQLSSGGLSKQDAGTWTLDGTNTYTGPTAISAGMLEVGGAGVLSNGMNAANITYTATIANSGTLHYNSTATQTLSGVISGGGALIKNNTGTLNLTGINSYSGATTISNGTLLVNGSLTNNASRVTVMSGGTLGGTGTVGIVTNNGTLSPGYGAVRGTLTTSNLVLNAGCTSVFDLNGTNANDSVAVNGNLTFSGVPAVVVNMSPVVYGTFPLFSVTGSYPTNTLPSLSLVSSTGGVTSKLGWGSIGSTNTLSVTLSASGTLLMVK